MTVEELKVEAAKLGYNIIKKQNYIKLLPCTCGQKKPWLGYKGREGEFFKCPNCGLEAPIAKTNKKARENWNAMLLTTQN